MESFYFKTRVLATALIVGRDAYYAFTSPSGMDFVNAVVAGAVIYAIWFARERVSSQKTVIEKIANV